MEEEVGFEPTERVNVRQFSRLLQSTALALLHTVVSDVSQLYKINFFCQESCYQLFIVLEAYLQNSLIVQELFLNCPLNMHKIFLNSPHRFYQKLFRELLQPFLLQEI